MKIEMIDILVSYYVLPYLCILFLFKIKIPLEIKVRKTKRGLNISKWIVDFIN